MRHDEIGLEDQAGRIWWLSEALGRSAVVLVFYRGDW
jgi:peroxiredoxin